ncbi:winged helix-turn-helix transcriptional regulator [Rhodovibrionaceae bacterium A322]
MSDTPDSLFRSGCPIATTLDLFGDRWTLLILRDLLTGKRRFKEFLESPEGIPTNILSSRLKRMEQDGLLTKVQYQNRPPRYEYQLTARGQSIKPVLQSICRWANQEFPQTWTPPDSFMQP